MSFLEFLKNYRDLIIILVTMIGWIVVFILGLWQQKKLLRNTAKMKIYDELYFLKKELDNCSQKVGLKFIMLPFSDMDFAEMSVNLVNGKSRATDYWHKYLKDLLDCISEFVEAYLKLWNHSEMWISAMPNLKKAKAELFENQLKELKNKLWEHQDYLNNLCVKQWNWKLWNRSEIKKRSEEMDSFLDKIAIGFVDDYMVLIHNELIAPVLGYKKKLRENFVNLDKFESYEILTKKGIKKITNIEVKHSLNEGSNKKTT